jgi:hypothetical protein
MERENRLRNRVEQQRWKIRQQGKQILDLVAKLNDFNAHVRQVIRWYQMQCDETAAKFSQDESETGQQMYWRADGASDALEWLVSQFPDKPLPQAKLPLNYHSDTERNTGAGNLTCSGSPLTAEQGSGE